MNCYYQLSNHAKAAFNTRLFYISLLILSSIYCTALLGFHTYTWLPIPILIANGFSLFNSLFHLADIIYENRPYPQIDDGLFICLFDIIPNLIIVFSILCYIIYLVQGLIINIQQEFALMIIYAVIIGCSIIPLIGIVLWYFKYCICNLYQGIGDTNYDNTV